MLRFSIANEEDLAIVVDCTKFTFPFDPIVDRFLHQRQMFLAQRLSDLRRRDKTLLPESNRFLAFLNRAFRRFVLLIFLAPIQLRSR